MKKNIFAAAIGGIVFLVVLSVCIMQFAASDQNQKEQANAKEYDSSVEMANHSNEVQKEQTGAKEYDSSGEMTNHSNENQKEQADVKEYDSSEEKDDEQVPVLNKMIVDVLAKKIELSDQYITGIYKNLYVDKEEVGDIVLSKKIANDINNAEIVELSIDNHKVFESSSQKDLLQYPIQLETASESSFFTIEFLASDEKDYFVQMNFSIETNNIINMDSYDHIIPSLNEEEVFINCLVKSKELYDDIEKLWGKRISISDLKNTTSIQIFYNNSSSFYSDSSKKQKVKFTLEDAGQFVKTLLDEAVPIYDEHSFGITFLIEMPDKNSVCLYYAEDGCSMFQLDGVSYLLKAESSSARLAEKYITRLKKRK